ncbi:hypothetical protein MG293_014855 [Ovis ammon polii]|uniref:Uncharacterized protein n=1 Tax=Ovis ammon polii TaxID=230172 RepID=A0AAD4Y5G8_OVIAM|nr:hypothetical protein MG293_014855 [Ovis ammon polii]
MTDDEDQESQKKKPIPQESSLYPSLIDLDTEISPPPPINAPTLASAGAHPAFPGSPSLLEEILATMATRDMPWSSPGAPVDEEGFEAILEVPLSEED